MNENLSITTDCSVLHGYLNSDIPDGVRIVSRPPFEVRGVDVNAVVNFDIQFTIDLTKITAYALASWIVKKSLTMKGHHHVNINDKQIPINAPEAVEIVTKEIEDNPKDE